MSTSHELSYKMLDARCKFKQEKTNFEAELGMLNTSLFYLSSSYCVSNTSNWSVLDGLAARSKS